MRIQVLALGKAREPFYVGAFQEYASRLSRHCSLQVREFPKEASGAETDLGRAYAAVRRDHLRADRRVALEAGGRSMDSPAFAAWLGGLERSGASLLSFVIGGPHGLARQAVDDSDLCLSLSSLTLPHQLARLVLLEQLYRGFATLRGEPYPK